MQFHSKAFVSGVLLFCLGHYAYSAGASANNEFSDPLNTASAPLRGALRPNAQPTLALARIDDGAHHRVVGAGLRGFVVTSDDEGKTWTQSAVPVQSDLVSLSFASQGNGWAVGHDGIILHSIDAGTTWKKQFDGNQAHDILTSYYRARIAAGEKELQPFLDEVELNTKSGATLPFLSVYFEDGLKGYAVGAFGMIVETDDGGKTWKPWLDRIDNKEFLNLNDIRSIAGDVYIAGERGSVYRLDRKENRFISVSTDYKGSFFHIVGNSKFLLAVGLNGTAYRSTNRGTSWERVDTHLHSSVTSAAMSTDDKGVLLAARDVELALSTDDGLTFVPIRPNAPMLFADVIPRKDSGFLLAGYQGIQRQDVHLSSSVTSERK